MQGVAYTCDSCPFANECLLAYELKCVNGYCPIQETKDDREYLLNARLSEYVEMSEKIR